MDSKREILERELEMDETRRRAVPLPSKMAEYMSNRTFATLLLGMAVLMLLLVTTPSFVMTKNKTVNLPIAIFFSLAAAGVHYYLPKWTEPKTESKIE